eukprot:352594-Chlamydomonas_euryale.AAC.10
MDVARPHGAVWPPGVANHAATAPGFADQTQPGFADQTQPGFADQPHLDLQIKRNLVRGGGADCVQNSQSELAAWRRTVQHQVLVGCCAGSVFVQLYPLGRFRCFVDIRRGCGIFKAKEGVQTNVVSDARAHRHRHSLKHPMPGVCPDIYFRHRNGWLIVRDHPFNPAVLLGSTPVAEAEAAHPFSRRAPVPLASCHDVGPGRLVDKLQRAAHELVAFVERVARDTHDAHAEPVRATTAEPAGLASLGTREANHNTNMRQGGARKKVDGERCPPFVICNAERPCNVLFNQTQNHNSIGGGGCTFFDLRQKR